MAKKSSGTTKDAAPKAKKAAVKKTAVKAAAKPKAETASKSGTPKAAPAKAAAPKAATKKAAPKKAAGPKLNERQVDFLNKIKAAGEAGYTMGLKAEERTLEALSTRKLVKRGAKNKETGKHPYSLTKLGEKHTGSAGTAAPAGGA
ncbi:MAG: hypothetical protein JWN86_507 [Planctomycetota bacterium]|nr:hypothetical protein [Planctomycetota bacterium]